MDSITKQMWNLIDSHDTKRFLTEAGNDIEAMKLAVAFQFTYLGIPYIYYGDEVQEDDANALLDALEKKYKNCDIELHYGGQPIYYYVISVE